MKLLIFLALFALLTGCVSDEGNHRGFVISKTNELTPDDPVEQIQP